MTESFPKQAWQNIMAGSKKKKVVQKEIPKGRHIAQTQNPESYYQEYPAWGFNSCDTKMWGFTSDNIGNAFWTEILPYLKGLETRTWNDIMVNAKKQNHSIDVSNLNPAAQKRLAELYVEQDSIVSLRISATHRIYGYNVGRVFNILWYDSDHGDNDTCVCRSKKKHT